MALHPMRRPVKPPVAASKEERAELRQLVERIEAQREGLRVTAAANPAVKNLLRVYGYYKADPGDASKQQRLLGAGRAVAALEAAVSD